MLNKVNISQNYQHVCRGHFNSPTSFSPIADKLHQGYSLSETFPPTPLTPPLLFETDFPWAPCIAPYSSRAILKTKPLVKGSIYPRGYAFCVAMSIECDIAWHFGGSAWHRSPSSSFVAWFVALECSWPCVWIWWCSRAKIIQYPFTRSRVQRYQT